MTAGVRLVPSTAAALGCAAALLVVLAWSAGCTTRIVLVHGHDAGPRDVGVFEPRFAVAAGVDHTCAIVASALVCTGSNARGQLGLRGVEQRLEPAIVETRTVFLDVSAGYRSTAVLTIDGDVLTFGDNTRGQLGRGEVPGGPVLGRVVLPEPAVRVSQRFEHGCAVLRSGALYCWGSNHEGELGQDDAVDAPDHPEPIEVMPGVAFVDVSAGQGHTCAVALDGRVLCWGRNAGGELGLGPGAPIQVRRPTEVPSLRARSIAAGQSHTCAIGIDSDLWCWGQDRDADGHAGPLGLPGSAIHEVPTRVDARGDWRRVSTDTFHTCGIRNDGSLYCWGRNLEGQLGLGEPAIRAEAPTQLGTDTDWAAVAVGRFHTCAQKRDGRIFCAGANRSGELGVGDQERRFVLTETTGPG